MIGTTAASAGETMLPPHTRARCLFRRMTSLRPNDRVVKNAATTWMCGRGTLHRSSQIGFLTVTPRGTARASSETRPETRGNVAELENALNELNTRLEADDEFREHGPKIVQNIADALAGVERTSPYRLTARARVFSCWTIFSRTLNETHGAWSTSVTRRWIA